MQKPDFEWYSARSDKVNGAQRCPFASANRCPRYYASLFLLGEVGIATKFSQADQVKLDKKWESFEATIGEEGASISGGSDNSTKAMSNFCPEVSYKIFGLFASGLYPHHGEIDRALVHERLGREGADLSDPRWQWASVTPCHYTECSEYSILQREGTEMKRDEQNNQSTANQVFHIGAVHGLVGNISNSQVTIHDYSSIHQLLIDQKLPKQDRRQLEDIMDELKEALPANKASLLKGAEDWIVKHKELLGTAAKAVGKAIGLSPEEPPSSVKLEVTASLAIEHTDTRHGLLTIKALNSGTKVARIRRVAVLLVPEAQTIGGSTLTPISSELNIGQKQAVVQIEGDDNMHEWQQVLKFRPHFEVHERAGERYGKGYVELTLGKKVEFEFLLLPDSAWSLLTAPIAPVFGNKAGHRCSRCGFVFLKQADATTVTCPRCKQVDN